MRIMFRTITVGIPGTAMESYQELSQPRPHGFGRVLENSVSSFLEKSTRNPYHLSRSPIPRPRNR